MLTGPVRFGIVGSGWRSEFYLRIAQLVPDRFTVAGVVSRREPVRAAIEQQWGCPTYADLPALLAAEPEFVVTSVPWPANPPLIRELVAAGMPVLAETPPAPTVADMQSLWADVGAGGLVQVAEQYLLLPASAARLALVRRGTIGTATSAQVSSTHGYHAMSILRGYLDAGFADADVRAGTFTAPLVRSLGRDGWPAGTEVVPTDTVIATVDFGDRMGLYDFTDGQWFHPLRAYRHTVRGSAGELVDDRLVRMADPRTPVESRLLRRQTGIDGDLEGYTLDTVSMDGEVLWRNPFYPARLSDEEIAIGTLLAGMRSWREGGPPPYPLAQACQDHLLSLAVAEAAATGTAVRTSRHRWAGA